MLRLNPSAQLFLQLEELLKQLEAAGIRHAAIGGLALNVHGYLRATHDLDFLIASEEEAALHETMTRLGYETLDRREDLSSYVRGQQRVDFLHARREVSRRLLAEAATVEHAGLDLRVVSPEGLLGFKIQAFDDDPRRLRDLADMLELLRLRWRELNLDEVRAYFALFSREDLLDDLLRAADPDRD